MYGVWYPDDLKETGIKAQWLASDRFDVKSSRRVGAIRLACRNERLRMRNYEFTAIILVAMETQLVAVMSQSLPPSHRTPPSRPVRAAP